MGHLPVLAPPLPPTRAAYGELTAYVAGHDRRQHRREMEARDELIGTRERLPAIKKGDVLLVKITHVGSSVVEFYLGDAMRGAKEVKRTQGVTENIEIWWRYPYHQNTCETVKCNDLNVKFKPWYKARPDAEAGGAKNQKNAEFVDRVAIVMIGVGLVKSGSKKGMIRVEHKKQIADLNVGFKFQRKNKLLTYNTGGLAV